MPIYGYAKHTGENGLHEMSEVSFHVPLQDLRRIARFLNDFADRAEAGVLRSDHVHLRDFDRAWNVDHPQSDVIVLHPAPTPPRPVK